MNNVAKSTKDITKMAIMSALVCIATYFFKIPSLNGYTHLGDSMIFMSVLVLGWKRGALAGGVGAAIADFLGGYMQWVIPTFLIKISMGVIMGLIAEKLFPNFKYGWIIGATIGGIFQIAGYTLIKIPMLGLAYALSTFPAVTLQTISGVIIASVLVSTLLASGAIRKLKEI